MKPYIIAEIGVNHNGSVDKAKELINAAIASNANAVKFQSFTAKGLASTLTPKVEYQKQRDSIRTHFEMLRDLELSHDEQTQLKYYCDSLNIEFISTPYSIEDAEFLNSLGVSIFKIASADIIDLPLIKTISKFNKLTLISTGMANFNEIEQAVNLFKENNLNFILMHTTSDYPTKTENTNILRLNLLKELSPKGIGFSDHTLGSTGAMMATALGCNYFEKHFTLSNQEVGPDHAASLTPTRFKEYVLDIQNAFKSLGSTEFIRTIGEEGMAKTSRKSLHFSHNLVKGHVLAEVDLIFLRPGTGLTWNDGAKLLGKKLKKDVSQGSILTISDFE